MKIMYHIETNHAETLTKILSKRFTLNASYSTGFEYDFDTASVILEMSTKVLEESGKYLSRVCMSK